jgi:hypothetical protein
MNLEEMIAQNPWWRNPSAVDSDPKIMEFNQSKIKWIPRTKAFIKTDKNRIYTLRGPRQVGKTTLLKLIIRELLSSGANPRSILYLTCDLFVRNQEIVDTIDRYFDFTKRLDETVHRCIILDEVSSIEKWELAIKHLADSGKLANTTMILTGSHSIDLKYSSERLPGRRGEGEEPVNKILAPMKFAEFVETVNPRLAKNLSSIIFLKREERLRIFSELFNGHIDSRIEDELVLYKKDLEIILDDYIVTGGIMRAIEQFHGTDKISNGTYEIYVRSMIGDLGRWRFQENIAKQILRASIEKMTTAVSLNSIAKENEIGSHNTVSSYLDALEDSFVLDTVYQAKLDDGLPVYKRQRKLYFVDPFILHATKGWIHGTNDYFQLSQNYLVNEVEKSKMIEMIVAGHLIRCLYNLSPSDVFSHRDRLFFWKSKKTGREVDFVMKHNGLHPVEVKYQNEVDKRDLQNLFSFGRGVIVSKNAIWTYRNYAAIPAEMFLMLI